MTDTSNQPNGPAESDRVTTITIQGLEFEVPQPYSAGQIELTEGEASALNQVLAENLRNNFAGRIKSAKDEYRKANNLAEEEDVPISALDQEALQEELDKYANEYEFGVRRGGGTRTPSDPVEREARHIAEAAVKETLRKNNVKLSSVPKEKFQEYVSAALKQFPQIREEAQRRVQHAKGIVLGDVQLGA